MLLPTAHSSVTCVLVVYLCAQLIYEARKFLEQPELKLEKKPSEKELAKYEAAKAEREAQRREDTERAARRRLTLPMLTPAMLQQARDRAKTKQTHSC